MAALGVDLFLCSLFLAPMPSETAEVCCCRSGKPLVRVVSGADCCFRVSGRTQCHARAGDRRHASHAHTSSHTSSP